MPIVEFYIQWFGALQWIHWLILKTICCNNLWQLLWSRTRRSSHEAAGTGTRLLHPQSPWKLFELLLDWAWIWLDFPDFNALGPRVATWRGSARPAFPGAMWRRPLAARIWQGPTHGDKIIGVTHRDVPSNIVHSYLLTSQQSVQFPFHHPIVPFHKDFSPSGKQLEHRKLACEL